MNTEIWNLNLKMDDTLNTSESLNQSLNRFTHSEVTHWITDSLDSFGNETPLCWAETLFCCGFDWNILFVKIRQKQTICDPGAKTVIWVIFLNWDFYIILKLNAFVMIGQYLKGWKKNRDIEKIICKVVQIKSLAMHIMQVLIYLQ